MAILLAVLREVLAVLIPTLLEGLRRPAVRSVEDSSPKLPSLEVAPAPRRNADLLRRGRFLRDTD